MSLSRRLANLGKAIDSATTGHFLSKGDSDGLFETIQYTDLTGRPTVLDSANVTSIVDSAYIQLRQTVAGSGGLDSAAVTTLVDSAYVSARSPAASSGFAAYEYNTSAAQTTFQDSDVNGNVLSYSADGIIVYYNGVLMPTSDYTATDGSSVVFTTAVDSGGTVTIAKWALASSGGSSVWYGDRGLIVGNYTATYTIEYIDITTTGNSTDFGDLLNDRDNSVGLSDGTYGVFAGGYHASDDRTEIDYVTIATTGNATDFGDLTVGRDLSSGVANSTRGVIIAGRDVSNTSINTMDYVTIATPGNATDFGDAAYAMRQASGGASDGTYGVIASGNYINEAMQYITIDTTGNATFFGYDNAITDFGNTRASSATTSDTTRGVIGGGGQTICNDITYFTIATTGNTTDFGDLTRTHKQLGATSNATRAVFCGGSDTISPFKYNIIDYITIQTIGNATDFGDLLEVKRDVGATSGSPS